MSSASGRVIISSGLKWSTNQIERTLLSTIIFPKTVHSFNTKLWHGEALLIEFLFFHHVPILSPLEHGLQLQAHLDILLTGLLDE